MYCPTSPQEVSHCCESRHILLSSFSRQNDVTITVIDYRLLIPISSLDNRSQKHCMHKKWTPIASFTFCPQSKMWASLIQEVPTTACTGLNATEDPSEIDSPGSISASAPPVNDPYCRKVSSHYQPTLQIKILSKAHSYTKTSMECVTVVMPNCTCNSTGSVSELMGTEDTVGTAKDAITSTCT